MRSPQEILFRLRQEAVNLRMLAAAPKLPGDPQGGGVAALPSGLPAAAPIFDALRGSDFAACVVAVAEEVRGHRFRMFGGVLETGPEIRWRRDYERGLETGLEYFRLIPYLDVSRAGDHKNIWELSRHQHLVALAQAFRFTGRQEYLRELSAQLETWLEQNPFPRGINWTSALEVAFRAVSWIWVLHLAGESLEPELRQRLCNGLYRHGRFIENNLSVYFSPNTHLLGEALALYAIGRLFPQFPGARRWEQKGAWWVKNELRRQVREDGGHFEQSSYYHVYALDMFLFHAILSGTLDPRLERMAEYLASLLGPRGSLPFLGDDDGGRWFHPYGPRELFGRATLATCGVLFHRPEWVQRSADLNEQAVWWLGPVQPAADADGAPAPQHVSRLFPATGVAVMFDADRQVIADGGPFGPGRAGHSHSDTLNLLVRGPEGEILVDPGTFTYVGDAAWRNRFRGSAAHNTMRVDGLDQADPFGPFGWSNAPAARILDWHAGAAHDYFDAECAYRGLVHRRRVLWIKPDILFVLDAITGPEGERDLEQFWHLAGEPRPLSPACFHLPGALLVFSLPESAPDAPMLESGWVSGVFGSKTAAPVMRIFRREGLPSVWASALLFGDFDTAARLEATPEGWLLDGPRRLRLTVSGTGAPRYHAER